ncbi:hypothetical protein CVT24_005473 [Panaeolus cyanescens]|uniref:Mitochondrial carrier n=1 Tax=Panaeolus cyanescens TaxID=181874 RepID=A0A409WGK2_9AGAR|nr:hypothetical protein CVT24_005473 [Panaeolus cyanescens]
MPEINNFPPWFYITAIVLYYVLQIIVIPPLTNVLVRFRANYNPKGLALEDADAAEQQQAPTTPVVGPVVKSYFAMFARVYRLEGIYGLFKGFVPRLIFNLFFNASPMRYRVSYGTQVDVFAAGDIVYILTVVLFTIPTKTTIYRYVQPPSCAPFELLTFPPNHSAMATPKRLSPFRPLDSFRALFSLHERSNIFRLYKNAGLFPTWILHVLLNTLFVVSSRGALLRSILSLIPIKDGGRWSAPGDHMHHSLEDWVLMVGFTVLGSLLLSPIEVILARLSLQKNNGKTPALESAEFEEETDRAVRVEAEEDVILLHPESDRYRGLVDCFKKIVAEEGWITLYRGFWATLLFGAFESSFI